MNYFDKAASTWDEKPSNIARTKAISEEMMQTVPLSSQWHALEYGCGTGLLSVLLHTHLGEIVLADESVEMLKVLEKKIQDQDIKNMHPVKLNLLEDSYDARHDCIYTQMALHHIKETEKIIGIFYRLLKDEGYLCIADLVEEDGSFHAHHDHYDGHNGFDPEKLKRILAAAGFSDVTVKICFEMEKELANNVVRKYPLFLMTGRKSSRR